MTYILLYIAALIAAMVGVGVIVAKLQPRPTPNSQDQDDGLDNGYALGPEGYGLYFKGFRLHIFDDDD